MLFSQNVLCYIEEIFRKELTNLVFSLKESRLPPGVSKSYFVLVKNNKIYRQQICFSLICHGYCRKVNTLKR